MSKTSVHKRGAALGIDYGRAKIGLSIANPERTIALPYARILATGAIERIADIVNKEEIAVIVVGLPQRMGGEHGPETTAVLHWTEELKAAVAVPVIAWDERLTTHQAKKLNMAGSKFSDDELAATLMLQSYLDTGR